MEAEETERIKGMLGIEKIRDSLAPDEREALAMLYDIREDSSSSSVEDIARKLRISKKMAAAIIESGIRKLRHPTRIKWYEETILKR